MERPIGRLGNVVLPADEFGKAVDFYQYVLGLPLKFRDGDRWAAFDAGGITLALAGGSEKPPGNAPALSFKVEDVAAALARAVAGGAVLVAPAAEGPHEIRGAVRDRAGHLVYFYSSRPKA
jgi:predicted enzyme related to lactoylglutathione lyase